MFFPAYCFLLSKGKVQKLKKKTSFELVQTPPRSPPSPPSVWTSVFFRHFFKDFINIDNDHVQKKTFEFGPVPWPPTLPLWTKS